MANTFVKLDLVLPVGYLPELQPTSFALQFEVVFVGADVPNSRLDQVFQVVIDAGDTTQTIKTKIVNAITAAATNYGFSAPQNQMVLPQYTKG